MDNRSSIFPAVGMAAKRQQPAAVARALGMQQGGMQAGGEHEKRAECRGAIGKAEVLRRRKGKGREGGEDVD
eukprot:762735-Hanusia_phi.AAC.1